MWTWERRENISIHISGSSRVPETSPWSSLIIIARQPKQAADTLRGCNSAAVWGKVVLSCCQFLPHPPFLFSHSGHFLMHFSSHFLAPFSFRLTPSQSKWRRKADARSANEKPPCWPSLEFAWIKRAACQLFQTSVVVEKEQNAGKLI